MNITFIGGGNMANALIGGLLSKGFAAGTLRVVEPDAETAQRLAERYGLLVKATADADILACDLVLLAVKPQQLRSVAAGLAPHLTQQLVLSIAAGVRAADLSRWLGGYRRLVRAMPNTPAMVQAGITGLYALPEVSEEERRRAEAVLAAVGEVVWVGAEADMDVITAVSGSGPAYVFYFMEALEEAAIALGLSASQARRLSLATFAGAARLASASREDVVTLRERVTSKGGTTERALAALEAAGVKPRIVEAVRAAALRARELGDELGRDGAAP
ncbi:pyrroline-5-carboxylate reductase [Thiobacter aerophilum]|uniref:Pyrroline-5-carboxylate reductase n=1 Tax=Thiobacter aerophilum TaxID=3121275 RepID=A0ABV0EKC6_9BURK